MLLAVRISSYGCTQEVRVALSCRLEQLLRFFRARQTRALIRRAAFSRPAPNFPRASITRYTHAKHEPTLKYTNGRAYITWAVHFQFRYKISVEFSASSFCLMTTILSNPQPTSSLWLLPRWDVYLNLSILTLFVHIFTEYFWLCLPTFSLELIRRGEFFIDNFRNQGKGFRSTVVQPIVAC